MRPDAIVMAVDYLKLLLKITHYSRFWEEGVIYESFWGNLGNYLEVGNLFLSKKTYKTVCFLFEKNVGGSEGPLWARDLVCTDFKTTQIHKKCWKA